MKYLCIGEIVIDFTSTGGLTFQGHPGGSSLNVSVAVARLGGHAGFAGQISTDLLGDAVLDHLVGNGVDTTFVERSDAPSTLGFVAERDGDAHFTFMANGAADTLYDPVPRPSLPDEVTYLQFGSIGLLHEPAATSIAEIVSSHRSRATVVFDPNVRPALTPDRDRYMERLTGWLALAHVVKLSTQDLGWLHPEEAPGEVAARWLAGGTGSVIVTDGAAGASWFRPGRPPISVAAPAVTVVDTVGAGDAFTGAVMVALGEASAGDGSQLDDDAARDVLRRGVFAATWSCASAGANPPRREQLDTFLAGT